MSSKLTEAELAEGRRLCEVATQGPWSVESFDGWPHLVAGRGGRWKCGYYADDSQRLRDAAMLSWAATNLGRILGQIDDAMCAAQVAACSRAVQADRADLAEYRASLAEKRHREAHDGWTRSQLQAEAAETALASAQARIGELERELAKPLIHPLDKTRTCSECGEQTRVATAGCDHCDVEDK